jgi:hypothetical protein
MQHMESPIFTQIRQYLYYLRGCKSNGNLVLSIFLYQKSQSNHSIGIFVISFTSFVSLFYLFVYGKLISF